MPSTSRKSASNRRRRFLLIDVSNSFTKIAFSSDERVGRAIRQPTGGLTAEWLKRFVRGKRYDAVVVSSVVPERTKILRSFFGNSVINLSHRCHLGIGIDYPEPGTIGADRLANAVAVAELYGAPSVVVDFGTAVTFDIVAAGPVYLGGVIAPGLRVMTDYLYQSTALLPRIDLAEPVGVIGKSTRQAMLAGAVYGYRGLVREILQELARELKPRRGLQVVATGGYAELISSRLPEIHAVNPALTLEGLRLVGLRNT
jgi:type III pantothenate kinase